jgi:hypothetical protein
MSTKFTRKEFKGEALFKKKENSWQTRETAAFLIK